MDIVLEIGSKNYADDLLAIKKALSHMESLVNGYNGYVLSNPSPKFGWTFFKLAIKKLSEEVAFVNDISLLKARKKIKNALEKNKNVR